jgi:hypothetical protein
VSLIPFPDVPNLPGVPSLARMAGLAVIPPATFAALDSLNLPFLQELTRWGVFTPDGATQVLSPTSIVAFEYGNEARVSDYPLEQGAFATYNKVATPFGCRVRMTIGGTEAKRSAFISTLDTMLAATSVYSVLTPERVYLNVTLAGYDFRRESKNGVTLLTIDCTFREVRLTGLSQFSDSGAPTMQADTVQAVSSAAPDARGQVQTVDGGAVDLKVLEVTATGEEIPIQ